MAAAAIIMGVGALVSVYGSIKEGEDKADAYNRQAQLKRIQADETMQAAQREAGLTLQKGQDIQQSQLSAFGRSGVDVGSGTPLAIMARTTSQARNEADAIMRAGQYRAFTSQYEAADSELLGQNAKDKGYITAVGSAFSAAGSYGKSSGKL